MTSYQSISPAQAAQLAPAHIIQSDTEALEIAQALSEKLKQNAVVRDAERILPFEQIEAYSQSGLWAITVPKQYGGAEVSSYTVARIIALMSGVDGSIGQIPQNHFYAWKYCVIQDQNNKNKSSIARCYRAFVFIT